MIITKTPLRLTLGGGGTDLPSYYSKYGGFVITTAVDKFVYLIVKKTFEDKLRVSYSKTEIVTNENEIQHPIVREALKLLHLSKNLEIISIADLPSNTGLGSSGSFTVGLMHALHSYNGEFVLPQQLAEEACHIQMDILNEPEGKQDPYIAALGNITCLHIDKGGKVNPSFIKLENGLFREFQHSLLFFYTGIKRSSSLVLSEQKKSIEKDETKVVESLHRIKEIGRQVKIAIEAGDIDEFGRLQYEHWLEKKNLSSNVSSPQIDHWFNVGMDAGAIGGKIMGAGGGGFLMFCATSSRDKIRKAMANEGLSEVNMRVGVEGTRTILNLGDSST